MKSIVSSKRRKARRIALERWRVHYQDRLRVLKQRLPLPREVKRYAAHKDRDLLPKLMNHTRRHLAKMRRQGIISEEVRRRIERDFDMDEQRIQRFLARLGRD